MDGLERSPDPEFSEAKGEYRVDECLGLECLEYLLGGNDFTAKLSELE